MPSEKNLNAVFSDTAAAIRSKLGNSETIQPIEFADKINLISGKGKAEIDLNVIRNDTYIPPEGKTYKKVIVNVPTHDLPVLKNLTIDNTIPGDPYNKIFNAADYSADGFDKVITNLEKPKEEQIKTVELNLLSGDQSIIPDVGMTMNKVIITKPLTLKSSNIKKNVNIGGVIGTLEPAKECNLQVGKVINPQISIQTISADSGYDGLESVIINPVTSKIDANIQPSNIKSGVNILGITGTLSGSATEEKLIDLGLVSFRDNNTLIFNPSSEGTTFSQVSITKDTDLKPENIKKGVTISGISGVLEGVTDKGNLDNFYPAKFYGVKDNDLSKYFNKGGAKYTDMEWMFYKCPGITTIPNIDTSNVINMHVMFDECISLTFIPQIDTSKVTTMFAMFNYCDKLQRLPLLDTHNVTDMGAMFQYCQSLTEIPAFDCTNVMDMGGMFNGCSALAAIHMKNINANLRISDTILEHDALIELISNLVPFDPNRIVPGEGFKVTKLLDTMDNIIQGFHGVACIVPDNEIRQRLSTLPAFFLTNEFGINYNTVPYYMSPYCVMTLGKYIETGVKDKPKTLTLGNKYQKLSEAELQTIRDKGWKVEQ